MHFCVRSSTISHTLNTGGLLVPVLNLRINLRENRTLNLAVRRRGDKRPCKVHQIEWSTPSSTNFPAFHSASMARNFTILDHTRYSFISGAAIALKVQLYRDMGRVTRTHGILSTTLFVRSVPFFRTEGHPKSENGATSASAARPVHSVGFVMCPCSSQAEPFVIWVCHVAQMSRIAFRLVLLTHASYTVRSQRGHGKNERRGWIPSVLKNHM